MHTNAIFSRKESNFEQKDCVVEKVIRLSGAEFDSFTADMLQDHDFIRDNKDLMRPGPDGQPHCLLVVGEGRRDGVLIDSSGYDYARYSAFIPNAEDFLTVGQSPALAALNKKLTDIVDIISEQVGAGSPDGRGVVNLQKWDALFELDLSANGVMLNTVLDMLGERPEIKEFELDKNELIIYREPEAELAVEVEDLSDPTVTRLDMNVYGYDYDGMVPLGKQRALELFDKGHEIYLLYEDGTEGFAESRKEIEDFGGLFGIEHTTPNLREQASPFEVLILNWKQYNKGEQAGEWLPLPADADTLRALFERIGIDGTNDSYTIANVRMPMHELLRDHVSKHDSLDELNMLASFMQSTEVFELDKFQAILTSRIVDVGNGTAALINLLDSDNLNSFNLINAHDAESLGKYYAQENNEKPDDISFMQYGYQCVKTEGGVFTEWGYLYSRFGEVMPEYNGVVPNEYKIAGEALRGLRPAVPEHSGSDEKPSVVEQIRAARQAPRAPKEKDTQKPKKDKGGPEL